MNPKDPLFAESDRFASIARETPPERPGVRTQATRAHEAIRRWATEHQAEPATGEATESGPARVVVNDGGARIRFNFPGFGPFRPIAWDEWFAHFDRDHLLFVFEEQDTAQVATRADELSHARGGEPGHDREDWFQAERDLRQQAGGGSPSVRYRFVRDDTAPQRKP